MPNRHSAKPPLNPLPSVHVAGDHTVAAIQGRNARVRPRMRVIMSMAVPPLGRCFTRIKSPGRRSRISASAKRIIRCEGDGAHPHGRVRLRMVGEDGCGHVGAAHVIDVDQAGEVVGAAEKLSLRRRVCGGLRQPPSRATVTTL